MIKKFICLYCNKKFLEYKSKKRKFCSVFCKNNFQIGKTRPDISFLMKNRIISRKTRKKLSEHMKQCIGEKSRAWKGKKVGYFGLHRWLTKTYGKPQKCQFCKTIKRRIEWANKTGEYLRELTDWLQLCTKCHRYYDYQNLTIHRFTKILRERKQIYAK